MMMDLPTCGLINAPFTILNIMANVFFIFCMVCHRARMKRPLMLLLGSLICCTTTYLLSTMVFYFLQLTEDNLNFMLASYGVFVCSLSTSMSSSAWLNFLYYIRIVPAQTGLFIWVRKNITPIIYCAWLFERIFSMLDAGVMLLSYYTSFNLNNFRSNFTMYHDTINLQMPSYEFLKNVYDIAVWIVTFHFIFCLCVMMMSSGLTVVYLCRHMCRMLANGQPLSCPRLRGQVRVTVTGILQGVLYLTCAMWIVYTCTIDFVSPCVNLSVFCLYMTGTTFNLGAGQGVFRQRAVDIWLRAARWCKALEVRQSEA